MRGANSFSSEGIGAFQNGKTSPIPFETFDIFPTGMVCTLTSTRVREICIRMYYEYGVQCHSRNLAGEPPLS